MEKPKENPDSIDAFLRELGEREGIVIEEIAQEDHQPSDSYSVRLMFSKLEDKYYLHSFIVGSVTENDFPGKLLKWQVTFGNRTLADVCIQLERGMASNMILYHRNPPEGLLGPGHVKASYELVPHLNDSNNETLLRGVFQLVEALYLSYSKGLW